MRDSSTRRVKIVCTLGPSTQTFEQIEALIKEGMDVARLNFSHGTHAFHKNLIENIRKASKKHNRFVAIMQDLQGPKLRLGKLPDEGVDFNVGDRILLYPEGSDYSHKPGTKPVPLSAEIAEAVANDVRVGAKVLFNDGKVFTQVCEVNSPEFVVEVEFGGNLTSHKGMNLPGTPLSLDSTTEKDYKDLKFGLDQAVDAVALSFVRCPDDITNIRKEVKKISNLDPLIISKIEREEAVDDHEHIIEVSDGLLVARGDMAVELGAARVPIVQKQLIRASNEVGVPIITATQMLESMISSPIPTRAEASDVANAVFDGTDAVMLSGETAAGAYPNESVRTMCEIILETEKTMDSYVGRHEIVPIPGSIVESIEFSAAKIASHVGASAIACTTHSGVSARTLAKYRPEIPIAAIMDNEASLRKLSFVWGIRGFVIPKIVKTDDLFHVVEQSMKDHGWAEDGDFIVVTAGIPTLRGGTTNMVKVHRIGAAVDRGSTRF